MNDHVAVLRGRFHDFTLDEALTIAKRNDPGENVPSVSRTLMAEIDRINEQHAALVARLGELGTSYRRDAAGDDDWQCCLETVADDLARVLAGNGGGE